LRAAKELGELEALYVPSRREPGPSDGAHVHEPIERRAIEKPGAVCLAKDSAHSCQDPASRGGRGTLCFEHGPET
jgi:hypothetical protein